LGGMRQRPALTFPGCFTRTDLRRKDQEGNPLQAEMIVQERQVSSPRRIEHGTDNAGRVKEVFIELEEAENLHVGERTP